MERKDLARQLRDIGFSCTRCGECCNGTENLVMVSPEEIEQLAGETGRAADALAEPYPECIAIGDGGSITFEWSLRKGESGCSLFSEGLCTVYASRPWICRTYPFMLDGGRLRVSACPGIGGNISAHQAWKLAGLLLERRRAEQQEEERIRRVLATACIPPGCRVLVDGRGVKVL
jgi:Fe-S-cluster containining protein